MLKNYYLIYLLKKYVIHYENLQLKRIEAKKNRSLLEFNQSLWLKQYLESITQKRTEAEKW